MNGYIYMLEDTRNGKKYIGKHNGSKKNYWSSGLIPNRIAKKYGQSIFTRTILEENIGSSELLNLRESFYIAKFNSLIDGYNMTLGGDGGGHWILTKSPEEIQKIALSKSAKLMNRKFSNATINKMKASHKGKKLTDQHKLNISNAVKLRGGFPHSDQTKEHLSKIRKGKPNPSHSEYMKNHNPNSQKILIFGIVYKSIKAASIELGITGRIIITRLNSNKEKYNNWIRL